MGYLTGTALLRHGPSWEQRCLQRQQLQPSSGSLNGPTTCVATFTDCPFSCGSISLLQNPLQEETSNLWLMGNSLIAAARELYSNHWRLYNNTGGNLNATRDWQYIQTNGPDQVAVPL